MGLIPFWGSNDNRRDAGKVRHDRNDTRQQTANRDRGAKGYAGANGHGANKGHASAKDGANRYQKPKSADKTSLAPRLIALCKWCLGTGLVLGIFFFIGVGLMHCYNFFISSEYFRVRTIEISGNYRLKSREVLDIVELVPGTSNTLAVSLEAMEVKLARNPWVGRLSVKRTLPDRFDITITEREPKYWVNRGGVLYYADSAGVPIMPVTAQEFASLPALEIEPGAEFLAQRLPELVLSLSEAKLPLDIASSAWLRLSAGGALELRPSDKLLVSIGIGDWARNLEHLDKILKDLSRRGELRLVAEIKAHGSNVWVSRRSGL